MNGCRQVWWKLAFLGLVEAALLALMFVPFKSHAILYNTPAAARGHGTDIAWQAAIALGGVAAVLTAFVIPIWLAYRVVRSHRNSN
jgi:hypothetical protein